MCHCERFLRSNLRSAIWRLLPFDKLRTSGTRTVPRNDTILIITSVIRCLVTQISPKPPSASDKSRQEALE